MREAVLVDMVRTPFGRAGQRGVFRDITHVELVIPLLKGILDRNKVAGDEVDEVLMGLRRHRGHAHPLPPLHLRGRPPRLDLRDGHEQAVRLVRCRPARRAPSPSWPGCRTSCWPAASRRWTASTRSRQETSATSSRSRPRRSWRREFLQPTGRTRRRPEVDKALVPGHRALDHGHGRRPPRSSPRSAASPAQTPTHSRSTATRRLFARRRKACWPTRSSPSRSSTATARASPSTRTRTRAQTPRSRSSRR